jgi:hypothetical protein
VFAVVGAIGYLVAHWAEFGHYQSSLYKKDHTPNIDAYEYGN